MRLVDKKGLRAYVPYSSQHIQRLEKEGKFPQRVQLGPCRVGWVVEEVEAWVRERASQRTPLPREE